MTRTPRALILALVVFLCIPVSAQTRRISTEASAHLTEIVSLLQKEWLYRGKMDWDMFRQGVFEKAGAAQAIPDTYDAIRLALTLLGDEHSYYVTASGENIFNPQSPTQSTGECTPAPLVTPQIPADVGYVRITLSRVRWLGCAERVSPPMRVIVIDHVERPTEN